jgi:hypothetical protein
VAILIAGSLPSMSSMFMDYSLRPSGTELPVLLLVSVQLDLAAQSIRE